MDTPRPISILQRGGQASRLPWGGGSREERPHQIMPQVVQVKNGANNNNAFLALAGDWNGRVNLQELPWKADFTEAVREGAREGEGWHVQRCGDI